MKQIDLQAMMINNGMDIDRKEILGMEFIKVGDKFMIKNSNGIIVDEKEKLRLENRELVIKDVESNLCQKETTRKLSKNKKKLEELDENIKETESVEE